MSFKSIKREKLIGPESCLSNDGHCNDLPDQTDDTSLKQPSGFIIQDMDDKRTTVITVLPGSAVNDKAIEFQEFILEKIERGRRNIIIEMKSCKLIESTFMGAMVKAQKRITGDDGNFSIVIDKNLKTSTLIFTDLDRIFRTHFSLSEAMEGVK